MNSFPKRNYVILYFPMQRHSKGDPQEGPSNLHGQRLAKRKKPKLGYQSLTEVQLCQVEISEFKDTLKDT